MATFSEATEHPLKKYELTGATIGKEIAGGAYGVVYELIWNGMRFAGKKIRDYLKPSVYNKKLTEECEKLMKMRHPCIVQFIGVHRPAGSDSLTIVMEYLPTTLSAAIQQYKSLPEEISFGILENVALGICFLHSQNIIHRDLSANNVLLDDNMNAKICDLGVAKMLDIENTQGKKTLLMTHIPGTAIFMPPESRTENPLYGTDLDIFSFGVLMVHIFYGDWPETTYDYPSDSQSKIDPKWSKYTEKIKSEYPSVENMVTKCLSKPSSRPDAAEVLELIRDEKANVPIYHGSRMRMVEQRKDLEDRLFRIKNDCTKDCEIRRLTTQIEDITRGKEEQETKSKRLVQNVQELETSVDIRSNEIRIKNELIAQKEREIEQEIKKTEQIKQQLDQTESNLKRKVQYAEQQKDQAECRRNIAWQQLSAGDQFHLLHTQSILTWEPVPQGVSITMTAPQYTIIGSKLYFGGGNTDDTNQVERKAIFELDTSVTSSDSSIRKVDPNCPLIHFGLGNIGGKLAVIGGRNHEDKTLSNKAYVLETNLSGTAKWSENVVPNLSVPRARVCVISQSEDESSTCLAACGGRVIDESTNQEVSSSLVAVYRKGNQDWVDVTSLPAARAALRVTCLHDKAYLLGGWNDMMAKSEDDCFSIVTDNLFEENTGSRMVWKKLSKLPCLSSAPAHLCGTLLALGGVLNGKSPILAFNTNMQEWIHIANLPNIISSATAAALPNGKLIIFGGWEKALRNEYIFIGQMTGRMF